MIPLGDASRRPIRFPIITALLIAANVLVFLMELVGGDAFINRWSLVPAILLVGFWFLTQLFSEVGALAPVQSGGAAYMAYIGGFIFGALAARIFESSGRRRQQGLERSFQGGKNDP